MLADSIYIALPGAIAMILGGVAVMYLLFVFIGRALRAGWNRGEKD